MNTQSHGNALPEKFEDIEVLDQSAKIVGEEAPTGWLNSSGRAMGLFDYLRVPPDRMMRWAAGWITRDTLTYGKPTKFEIPDGRY